MGGRAYGLSLRCIIFMGDIGAERWPLSEMSTTSDTMVGLSFTITARGLELCGGVTGGRRRGERGVKGGEGGGSGTGCAG